jgi:exocyst complex component 8
LKNSNQKAIDLFIDYHKHLNSETLRKIKLEESNAIYMNNVLNSFFENLRVSFESFREAFAQLISYCYSTYISWADTEIEILLKKLQSQHYLGRHFDLTIENCQLIFDKAREFSSANHFEVNFLFETKLIPILEASIKEQHDILIDASVQRSKLELDGATSNTEQNRQVQIEKFLKNLEMSRGELSAEYTLKSMFKETDLKLVESCTSSGVQFARGILNFFCDCLKVFYQEINFCLVETIVKLVKGELKIYKINLDIKPDTQNGKKLNPMKKQDIYNNVCLMEAVFDVIQKLYFKQTSVNSKFFVKMAERIVKFKEENFL